MRVPDQKVHIYSSHRWIAIKFFSRVSGGCLPQSGVESGRHDDDVLAGHSTGTTRVPDQKVPIYRSDRWIALKFFHEFPKAVSHGGASNRDEMATTFWRASPPAGREYQIKRSLSIDPTVGSRLNFFHEFSEAVSHGAAWNRDDRATTSWRSSPPAI